jgi:hypothetical protein
VDTTKQWTNKLWYVKEAVQEAAAVGMVLRQTVGSNGQRLPTSLAGLVVRCEIFKVVKMYIAN